jgi:hypothetical protein
MVNAAAYKISWKSSITNCISFTKCRADQLLPSSFMNMMHWKMTSAIQSPFLDIHSRDLAPHLAPFALNLQLISLPWPNPNGSSTSPCNLRHRSWRQTGAPRSNTVSVPPPLLPFYLPRLVPTLFPCRTLRDLVVLSSFSTGAAARIEEVDGRLGGWDFEYEGERRRLDLAVEIWWIWWRERNHRYSLPRAHLILFVSSCESSWNGLQ